MKERIRALIEDLRTKFGEFREKLRARFSEFSEKRSGLSINTLRSAKDSLAPMAQKGLLSLPGLDETLKKFSRYEWAVWILAGLACADLSMTLAGNLLSGDKSTAALAPAPTKKIINLEPHVRNFDEYARVISVNPFCPGCPIPDIAKLQRPKDCGQAKPLANAGSAKLIGTIVLSDPKYSVATVTQGADSIALQKGDNLPGVGEVYEIRQGRVCFLIGTGALQYIELPQDLIKFETPATPAPAKRPMNTSSVPGIDRVSDTEFVISKEALKKKLEDPTLLSDAQAVPHREDGELKGFKLLSIRPGSVYESLGVQVGDVITGVNGEPMNSVAKAQELFVGLMSLDKVTITVNRNGQDVTQTYSIR